MDTARRLDPLTPIVQTHVGWIEYFARNYDEAIRQYQLVLQAAPEVNAARWRLGQAYIQKEMLTEAKNELRKSSSDPHALALLGYALAVSGETVEANRILAQLIKTSRTHYVPPVNMAIVCVGLRKTDTALEWLQRGVDDRDYWLTLLNVDPMFYEFRSDPRVTKLLNNVGLGTERK
jgi:tetratricopeptide (TPR) repeat protein